MKKKSTMNTTDADQGTPVSVKIRERIQAARKRFHANDNIAQFVEPGELEQLLDEVAHCFGVTRRHVDQRLALSGLAPKIKAAWKKGDVTLDAARAFCLVEDHGRKPERKGWVCD